MDGRRGGCVPRGVRRAHRGIEWPATVCSGVGLVVTLVGELVAAVREFLRDLIADAVGRLIAWALQVAATLGVGITWVAPQAAAFCAKVAANIADIVRKLLKTLRNVSRRIADLMKSFDDIRGVLQRLARRDGRSPDAADNAPASTSPTASPTAPDSSTSPLTTTSPSSTPTAPVSDIDSRAGNSDGPSRGSDETTPPDELSQSPSETVSDRTGTSIETSDDAQHAARETVIRNDGQPIGVEDSPGVRIVSEDELQRVRDDLHTTLGAPAHKLTPKGTIEVWTLSRDPHVTVRARIKIKYFYGGFAGSRSAWFVNYSCVTLGGSSCVVSAVCGSRAVASPAC